MVSHGADRVGSLVDARWSREKPVNNYVSFGGKKGIGESREEMKSKDTLTGRGGC